MDLDFANWWNASSQKMLACRDEETALQTMTEVAGRLGFSHCSVKIYKPFPFVDRQVAILATYPGFRTLCYRKEELLKSNFTVRKGTIDASALVWRDHQFSAAVGATHELNDSVFRVGITQPSWSVRGRYGTWSLLREDPLITDEELFALRPYLLAFAPVAISCISRLVSFDPRCCDHVKLTSRETEVLRWTADGKSSKDIAKVLSISHSTVDFHLRNCMRKFDATSRIQAVAYSLALGLI